MMKEDKYQQYWKNSISKEAFMDEIKILSFWMKKPGLSVMAKRETQSSKMRLILLKHLLSGEFVSGSFLAKEMGISRVSVWEYLEKLKEEGFDFEAVRNRGYRLINQPDCVNKDLINAYLKLKEVNVSIFFKDELDTTMNEAERLLAAGESSPLVSMARYQALGRGRRGRHWASKDLGGLYMSFGFKFGLDLRLMGLLTPLMAVHLCDLLNEKYGVLAQVKWPNDLMLNEKKICGMLAESRMDMDQMRDLIFGVGLNVNDKGVDWPEELVKIASTLEKETGCHYNINELGAEVIKRIIKVYTNVNDQEFISSAIALWEKYDYLKNKEIKGVSGVKELEGVAKGINANGELKVLLADGSLVYVSAGEFQLNK